MNFKSFFFAHIGSNSIGSETIPFLKLSIASSTIAEISGGIVFDSFILLGAVFSLEFFLQLL
jgi:hypothetical protein